MADSSGGLIRAVLLDGRGGGRSLDWGGVRAWKPEDGVLWVHLDREHPDAQAWIRGEAGLDVAQQDALVLEGSRPRALALGGGMLLILRGINHNPGRERSDMVSLRMWVEPRRLVTLRHDRMLAPQNVAERVLAGNGAATPAQLVIELVRETSDMITPVIDELEDQVAEVEERVVTDQTRNLRSELADVRREAIALRRYLAPQRDALQRLSTIDAPGAEGASRLEISEQADRMTRFVEDLDAVRERAVVASEELASRLSDQMNRRMYVLSIVTAVFLPLSLVTGLLGINVGGIPGTDNELGFAIVTGGVTVMAVVQFWVLRKLRWM